MLNDISNLQDSHNNTLFTYKNADFFRNDIQFNRPFFSIENQVISPFDLKKFINTERVFDIGSRKYIGSKDNLLPFLEKVIIEAAGGQMESFFDGFSGTGVVAEHFRRYSGKVLANDCLVSNYTVNRAFLNSSRDEIDMIKTASLIEDLNNLEPVAGYASRHFGGTYFTRENAGLIDAIRDAIDKLEANGQITGQEKTLLVTSLLYAADKAANTAGQYDAYLKGMGRESYENGRHRIDANVYKRIRLKRPFILYDGGNEVYHGDINTLAPTLQVETVYLDPPYNSRQYIDNYHVLENISTWEKPAVFGKTRKFNRDGLKSAYSRRATAAAALKELVTSLKCRHIFLSYNSEGIISDDDIITILEGRGRTEIFEKEYPVFGNGAGVSRKRNVVERVFYCKCR